MVCLTTHYLILMRFRRKGRPATRGSWTRESSAKAHAAKARKRMEIAAEPGPVKLRDGEFLGVFQWHDASGQVRRWIIRQGPRANNLRVSSKGREAIAGWDHFFRVLRKHLAAPRRTIDIAPSA